MNKNDLGQILKIVANPNTDYKAIALEVARRYPTTFLKCSGLAPHELTKPVMSDLAFRLLPFLRTGQIINAIREYRGITQSGLKEAKDACEALQNKWRKDGTISANVATDYSIHPPFYR